MRRIARDLMNDSVNGREDRASRNDGQLIARMVQSGTATAAALDAAIDEIENASVPNENKREALRTLESFRENSASGLGVELYGVSSETLQRLSRKQITSVGELLNAASTTAKRELLAPDLGLNEKGLRRLVKQADLQRAGIDSKLAQVLVDIGVDSIPELATRNVENLRKSLETYAKSHEGYVRSFKTPSKTSLAKAKVKAQALPRALEFGRVEDSFSSLSLNERIDVFTEGDSALLRTRSYEGGLVSLFAHLGVGGMMPAINEMKEIALSNLSSELDFHEIDVPEDVLSSLNDYDELISWVEENLGESEADALGNGWAALSSPSEIDILKSGRERVGARIVFSRTVDGDHDYNTAFFYDHAQKRIVASMEFGYEAPTEIDSVSPASALSGSETFQTVGDIERAFDDVKVGNQKVHTWGYEARDKTVDDAFFKSVLSIRHDNMSVTDLGTNDLLTQGLSPANKAKVDAGLNAMRTRLSELKLIQVEGGMFGDGSNDTVVAGKDSKGQIVTAHFDL